MIDFTLERLAHDAQSTHSQFLAPNGITSLCHAIERAKDGQDHQRIASGRYKLVKRPFGASHFDAALKAFFPQYTGIIEIANVPSRSNIEIHPANKFSDLLGCVAPCQSAYHDPVGGWIGVSSRSALANLYRDHFYPAIDAGDTFLIVRDLD